MRSPPLGTIPGDIAACIAFFTRLPMPRIWGESRPLADVIWAAPVAGLIVALLGGLTYTVAVFWALSAGTAAALALAAMMLVTGCLHEDGLSDVADGFGGGSNRDKKLEIMRDSRIGAYGACALALSILVRWSAIADLASPIHVFAGLVAAHAASRALLPAFMHVLAPARLTGLAATAGGVTLATALTAAALGGAALLALGISAFLAAVALLAVASFLFGALCRHQIGGYTGDTLGAFQQVAEATVLITASAYFF